MDRDPGGKQLWLIQRDRHKGNRHERQATTNAITLAILDLTAPNFLFVTITKVCLKTIAK